MHGGQVAAGLWCLIRWGRDGRSDPDPEFEEPGPFMFSSAEKAVAWCVYDVEDCCMYADRKPSEDDVSRMRRELSELGRTEFDRGDVSFMYSLWKIKSIDRQEEK